MLEIENLSLAYDGDPVLHNINLRLQSGEILCLLGQSGSGKTTLLRAIAGLKEPAAGRIAFAGRNLADIPPHKRGFGMMFQDYALFPHKSVAENIAFGLEMQKLPGAEKQSRIDEMLQLVGLAGHGNRRIDQLSGGQQQRVALARSLAPRPRLLLLDEPLGSLDRSLRDHLAEELRTILKRLVVSAVFVTHDQAEAFAVADRVAVMLAGRLARLDTPEELYRNPQRREVAEFLGLSGFVETAEGLLLLRPEGARLGGAVEDGIVLHGTVRRRLCLGGHFRVTMAEVSSPQLGSVAAPLTFELPLMPPPPPEGKKIELTVAQWAITPIKREGER